MSGVSNGHLGQINNKEGSARNGHCITDACTNGNPQKGDGTKNYKTELKCVDGNWAVAHAAYRMNDCAYIFPITPSSVSQKDSPTHIKDSLVHISFISNFHCIAHGGRSRCLGG